MALHLLHGFGCHKADRACLSTMMALVHATLANHGIVLMGTSLEQKLAVAVIRALPRKVTMAQIDDTLENIIEGRTAFIHDDSWEHHLLQLYRHATVLTLVLEMLADGFGGEPEIVVERISLFGVTDYADQAFKARLKPEEVAHEVYAAFEMASSRLQVPDTSRMSHLVNVIASALPAAVA